MKHVARIFEKICPNDLYKILAIYHLLNLFCIFLWLCHKKHQTSYKNKTLVQQKNAPAEKKKELPQNRCANPFLPPLQKTLAVFNVFKKTQDAQGSTILPLCGCMVPVVSNTSRASEVAILPKKLGPRPGWAAWHSGRILLMEEIRLTSW